MNSKKGQILPCVLMSQCPGCLLIAILVDPVQSIISRTIIHHDNFIICDRLIENSLLLHCQQTFLQDRQVIIGRDDYAEMRF